MDTSGSVMSKETILLKVRRNTETGDGMLGVYEDEVLELIDKIPRLKAKDLLLAQNSRGDIGYVPFENVDFIVSKRDETSSSTESFITTCLREGQFLFTSVSEKGSSRSSVSVETLAESSGSEGGRVSFAIQADSAQSTKLRSAETPVSLSKDNAEVVSNDDSYFVVHTSSNQLDREMTEEQADSATSSDFSDCVSSESECGNFYIHTALRELFYILEKFDGHYRRRGICLLNELCYKVKSRSKGEMEQSPPSVEELRELLKFYLEERCQETRIGLLCFLKLLSRKVSAAAKHIIQSGLPIVLMSAVIHENPDDGLLRAYLRTLTTLFLSSSENKVPSDVKNLTEKCFVTCLLDRLVKYADNKELQFAVGELIACIYRFDALSSQVVSGILAAESTEMAVFFIEMARKKGTKSVFWQLLSDLLYCEGSEMQFSKDCLHHLVKLVEKALPSMTSCNKGNENYLSVIDVLCRMPYISVGHMKQLEKCLCKTYINRRVSSEKKTKIWTLLNNLQKRMRGIRRSPVDDEKCASVFPELLDREDTEIYIPAAHLKQVMLLDKYLRSFVSLTDEVADSALSSNMAKILSSLKNCQNVLPYLHFYPIHSDMRRPTDIPYNLERVYDSLDAFNIILLKIYCPEAQKIIVKIIIEFCDLFPQVVSHLAKLKFVPCFMQEMKSYFTTDKELFQLCAVLLRRILQTEIRLPTAILKCLTENFIVNLIDCIENASTSATFVEDITALILAINSHRKNRVLSAFSHHYCYKTIQTILHFLEDGQSPLVDKTDELVSLESSYAPLKMYCDLLETPSTANLLREDCLQSVTKFLISHLTMKSKMDAMPYVMVRYVSSIFYNCSNLLEIQTSTCARLFEEANATFGQNRVLTKNALHLCHQLRNELRKMNKIQIPFKFKSYCRFPDHFYNTSVTRECMSSNDLNLSSKTAPDTGGAEDYYESDARISSSSKDLEDVTTCYASDATSSSNSAYLEQVLKLGAYDGIPPVSDTENPPGGISSERVCGTRVLNNCFETRPEQLGNMNYKSVEPNNARNVSRKKKYESFRQQKF